jgi:hypothetical protein
VSTAGRVQPLILVLALAACAIAGLGVFLSRETTAPSSSRVPEALASRSPPAAPIDPGPRLDPTATTDAAPPREASNVKAEGSRRFEGRGVVRGEILAREGAQLPKRWTLSLEPHPWLEGHEHAETRRVEFENGEAQFEVRDLALGGYLVRARTEAENCVPANVLLVRSSSEQFVTLLLLPSGFIDGGVLDSEGRPAEGLDVTLESTETRQRATLTTDAAGTFLFRDVLDGEYKLSFGRPDSPLLPAESIDFRAPSLRFPTRTLPPTGSLKINVIDARLHAKPRVQISGSALTVGAIDTFSDQAGIARARFLPPGHYRIDARSEDGLEASATIDILADRELPLEMLVRKRETAR